MRVVVCHPGRQHSHQLAMALAGQGMLSKYITGVPTQGASGRSLSGRLLGRIAEACAVPIDPALVKHVYVSSILRKAAGRLLSRGLLTAVGHRSDGLFDRYVRRFLAIQRPDFVVASENSALHTFRQARELGITTILDAASFHHRWQDRFFPPAEGDREHRRITRQKDDEIKIADQILTVSNLARESYLEAGIPSDRVHAIPVGVDTSRFHPGDLGREASERELRFVYIGKISRLKGIDTLRDAFGWLRAAGARLAVTLIGVGDAATTAESDDGLARRGWMSHERLADELPRHDVLVLPSFVDSFGMVVAEAMACGLPAIVTENVGAREMIGPRENGLVVPAGDAGALAEAMRWFIENRERLPAMSRSARQSAERYDWKHYHRRVVEFFSGLS